MWHTQLGDRVLEAKEAAFYLLAAQEAVSMLQGITPDEMEGWLPSTWDTVFDSAQSDQKIILLHKVLLTLLDARIPPPELTNVIEAAVYLPFQVMKMKVEQEIDLAKKLAWEEEQGINRYWYRSLILETCKSLNWKIDADIERPKIRSSHSTNVDLWIEAIEALESRIFWDDDWKITTRCLGILEGKRPDIVEWGRLGTYLTSELPETNKAQVVMAVQAIDGWNLPK